MKSKWKLAAAMVMSGVIVPSLCVFFFVTNRNSRTFDSAVWRSCPANERQGMAEEFLDYHYKAGMSVADVEKFLGKPDYSAPVPGVACSMSYIVGSAVIDYIILTFDVDPSGRTSNPHFWQTS